MIQKMLKITAVYSVILLVLVFTSSLIYSSLKKEDILAKEKGINQLVTDDDSTVLIGRSEISDKGIVNDTVITGSTLNNIEFLGDKYIFFPLLKSASSIEIVDLYRNKSIQITVSGVHKEHFNPLVMKRINGNTEYSDLTFLQSESEMKSIYVTTSTNSEDESLPINYELNNDLGSNVDNITKKLDPVIEYQVEYNNISLDSQDIVLTIKLDEVYAPKLLMGEDGIYISLKKPKDVYENIIVIDAGHGGKDPGTYSTREKYYEKDFNLSIVSLLKEALKDDNIKVYYTRLDDETVYLNPRVSLANELEADLFLSIHFNASEAPSARGSEVLYNELDTNTTYNSKMFATHCLDELLRVTKKVNRGLVEGNEMVIIGNAKMPVALVEVGFITNDDELNFLLDISNQKAIADALHQAILKSFKELN
jgi:N-acetylmuramoyl-L-alanine amidase